MDIHVRLQHGHSLRRIARELGISRNTVKRHLARQAMPSYSPRATKVAKLDPYKSYIQQRIEHAKPHWIPASVLFIKIQQRGYKGGISILRQYLVPFKQPQTDPLIRFETLPGQQMQIDFTTIRRGKRPLKAFVATLGYSRASFVKFFDNERAESWQQGLREAFEFFGGVPEQVLCDNDKTLIIQRNSYGEGLHKLHDHMLQMAKDYDFRLTACRSYRAQTKGKVERFNHTLKIVLSYH